MIVHFYARIADFFVYNEVISFLCKSKGPWLLFRLGMISYVIYKKKDI
jgi:hypothetical protein